MIARDGEQFDGYGWKFLNPYGATENRSLNGDPGETRYILPRPDQKWGNWMRHPQPAKPDGSDCGAGRLHIMKRFDSRYAPSHWWPWYVQYRGIVGESEEKVGAIEVRLRLVTRKEFWRVIRLGWLKGADLTGAYLRYAYLRYASLRGVDLRYADLKGADLKGAVLRGADLTGADLTGAYLMYADLMYADLKGAVLKGAVLRGAVLTGADISIDTRMDDDQRELFEKAGICLP